MDSKDFSETLTRAQFEELLYMDLFKGTIKPVQKVGWETGIALTLNLGQGKKKLKNKA